VYLVQHPFIQPNLTLTHEENFMCSYTDIGCKKFAFAATFLSGLAIFNNFSNSFNLLKHFQTVFMPLIGEILNKGIGIQNSGITFKR
jgi:hypothetical protein